LQRVAFFVAATCLALPTATSGAVASYTFDGGTRNERATVVLALEASSFDWTLIPGSVTIHIVPGEPSRSLPREIWLDADLLDAGEFAWGVVQHEYAHQVDYLLLDDAERETVAARARRPRLVLQRAGTGARPVRLRTIRLDTRLVVLAVPGELHAPDSSTRRVGSDGAGEVSSARLETDESHGRTKREEALMPGWLTWTLVGLGIWFALSVVSAFLVGHLLGRRPASRRAVILAAPASSRRRARARSRTLTRSG
jgi:hypothetical protein